MCAWETFEEVCARYGATLDPFETDRDRAHVLVSYPPKVALSTPVMSLKTISSMRVRQQDWPEVTRALLGEHFWSPSFCVVSAGGAPLEIHQGVHREPAVSQLGRSASEGKAAATPPSRKGLRPRFAHCLTRAALPKDRQANTILSLGRTPAQPTEPSIWSSINLLHSTAYSIGRVRVTGSMNPFTIMPIAWLSDKPLLIK